MNYLKEIYHKLSNMSLNKQLWLVLTLMCLFNVLTPIFGNLYFISGETAIALILLFCCLIMLELLSKR